MATCAALITAAGSSTRMGGLRKKEYLLLAGRPVLLHSLEAFGKTGICFRYIVTVPAGGEDEAKTALAPWLADPQRAAATRFVPGGNSRQASVFRGLLALEGEAPDIVLIHDGARPWIEPDLIERVHRGAVAHGACLPLLPSVDALKRVGPEGFIEDHPPRDRIFGAQTPQGFRFRDILAAHRQAAGDGRDYVDDTEIFDVYAGRVFSVPGSGANKKITHPGDLPPEDPGGAKRAGAAEAPARTEEAARTAGAARPDNSALTEEAARAGATPERAGAAEMPALTEEAARAPLMSAPEARHTPEAAAPRIGFGYDLHRLVEGRKLLIGGVHIPAPFGEEGHSDGDVLIHAVIDALLGAARLGDIGSHFPPSDAGYRDISSRVLLRRTAELLRKTGLRLGNLDCTVVLEKPRLLPHREEIVAALAEDLGADPALISVKGKTKEKVDAVGEGRAVEAFAAALLL